MHDATRRSMIRYMSAASRERLFNVSEAARYLAVSRRTVYDLVASGELPAYRVGGAIRLSPAAVNEWLASRRTGPQTPAA